MTLTSPREKISLLLQLDRFTERIYLEYLEGSNLFLQLLKSGHLLQLFLVDEIRRRIFKLSLEERDRRTKVVDKFLDRAEVFLVVGVIVLLQKSVLVRKKAAVDVVRVHLLVVTIEVPVRSLVREADLVVQFQVLLLTALPEHHQKVVFVPEDSVIQPLELVLA